MMTTLNDSDCLAIIQVGDIESSNLYVEIEKKVMKEMNINFHHYWFAANISEADFVEEVELLLPHYKVISILLPLPIGIELDRLCSQKVRFLKFPQEIVIIA